MDPIVQYLTKRELPLSKIEARKVLLKSQRYAFADGVLYKKLYLRPWLKCMTPEEESYILHELHKGICENHVDQLVLA